MFVAVSWINQTDIPCMVELFDGEIMDTRVFVWLFFENFRYKGNTQLAVDQTHGGFNVFTGNPYVWIKGSRLAHFAAHTAENVVGGEHDKWVEIQVGQGNVHLGIMFASMGKRKL